jgi:protein-S-isoprenylcysteine O-methyltransferase Ste14
MALNEDMVRQGTWLFRWRSYVPLAFLVLLFTQVPSFRYLGGSPRLDLSWEVLCMLVSLAGFAVRVHTVGHAPRRTSGRNTKRQVADELNTSGMYSVVRHPLYVGNYLMWLGVVMLLHTVWLVLLVSAGYALYYERIMAAEENFLRGKFGARYEEWAGRTPAFLANPRLWRPATLPFSAKTVLRREYSGFFGLMLTFVALEVASESMLNRRLMLDPVWMGVLGASLAAFLILRFLKRHTDVLKVAGRS